jgi:hypothetical protein
LTFVIEGLPGSISGLKAARSRAVANNNSNRAHAISRQERQSNLNLLLPVDFPALDIDRENQE